MAVSASTFSNAGGAVTDLFNAFGAEQQANISAQGTRLKAAGDLSEADQYDLAQTLAEQNKQYTATSTNIQQSQLQRSTTMQIGGEKAAQAGAGFAASGSGLDVLADSASQGALAKETLGQQGLITEAGYEEQANSYGLMASTARTTAAGEEQIASEQESAGKTSMWGDIAGGILKGAAAVASIAAAPATGGASLAIGGLLMGGGSPSGYGSGS